MKRSIVMEGKSNSRRRTRSKASVRNRHRGCTSVDATAAAITTP